MNKFNKLMQRIYRAEATIEVSLITALITSILILIITQI